MSKRTLTIRNLVTGEMGTVIDVTGKPESQVEKIERGMLAWIDLESWAVYDSAEEEA